MGFFDKFNKAKKNKKKDFVKEEASTNEGIKPIIRASTSVSSATKDESSKGTTTATTLSSMTFEEQVNYEAIPILEQTKLPRGGVSVHTEGVGRVPCLPVQRQHLRVQPLDRRLRQKFPRKALQPRGWRHVAGHVALALALAWLSREASDLLACCCRVERACLAACPVHRVARRGNGPPGLADSIRLA